LAAAVSKALDVSALDIQIDVSFNVPEESKASVLEAINGIKAYGVDAEAALEAVRRQWALNGDQTDASNQKVIASAGTIASAYEAIDLTELIQESTEMAGSLGMSQQEALGMTDALLKMGFPPEQLDIITEYGAQLSRAGYSAEEIQGIFAAGVETDSWNIDVLLDGVKEGRILMAEFGAGVDETTTKLIEGTGISATQLQTWGKAVAEGGAAGKTAMTDVTTALMGIEDETKRNQVGVELFGTLWEENGDKIGQTILGATEKTGDLTKNNDGLNKSMAALNADPQVRLNTALQDMQTALRPILTFIAELIAKIADWISENQNLAAGIGAAIAVVTTIIGLITALTPLFVSLKIAAAALNIAMLPMTGTVLAIIAAIAAIIAIGVLLYKNWDEITAAGKKLNDKVEEFFTNIVKVVDEKIDEAREAIVTGWTTMVKDTNENLEEMKTKVTEAFFKMIETAKEKWEEFKKTISDKIKETQENIATTMQNILTNIQEKWESIKTNIETKMSNIVSMIKAKWEDFKETIRSKMEETFERIKAIWGNITSFFQGISLLQIGKDIINTLISGIAGMAGSIRTGAENLWGNVSGYFKGVSLYNIGRDIIQGLINGVGSMAKALWAKATSLAEGIGARIKKALKAKSPSRVTMALGEFAGEGLIEGLDHTVRRVKSMAEKLAHAAVPKTYMTEAQAAFLNKSRSGASKIGATAAPNPSSNKSYVVNLHSPKALDIREATRLFQRTLSKMSLMW